MKRLKLSLMPILIAVIFLLSGASESAKAASENLPEGADKNKNSPQVEKANPKNQTQRIAPTELEKSLIETLRTIANQQRTAYEEARADQKPWWIDSRACIEAGTEGRLLDRGQRELR